LSSRSVRLWTQVSTNGAVIEAFWSVCVKEIAAHLGNTERTVKTYLSSIYAKLEVDSRAAAVAKALGSGLLSPQDGKW
jgi:FixJ family two-component response regulator